jgi:hypothetical protein
MLYEVAVIIDNEQAIPESVTLSRNEPTKGSVYVAGYVPIVENDVPRHLASSDGREMETAEEDVFGSCWRDEAIGRLARIRLGGSGGA